MKREFSLYIKHIRLPLKEGVIVTLLIIVGRLGSLADPVEKVSFLTAVVGSQIPSMT